MMIPTVTLVAMALNMTSTTMMTLKWGTTTETAAIEALCTTQLVIIFLAPSAKNINEIQQNTRCFIVILKLFAICLILVIEN